MKAFLDVNVGDVRAYQREKASYDLGCEYLRKCGPMLLGLDPNVDPNTLDEESTELLVDSFNCDPTWNTKDPGVIRLRAPEDIRAGRLVFELFDAKVPKTCENFKCLLTGEKGTGKSSGKLLHYKGCCFHRIIAGFMMQGGDVVKGDGSAGDSIYGGKFNDEKPGLKIKHLDRGTLAMANGGKNTNTSQFYVTFGENLAQLDGKHVVFGKVVEGTGVLDIVERQAASKDGKPLVPVTIGDCGVY